MTAAAIRFTVLVAAGFCLALFTRMAQAQQQAPDCRLRIIAALDMQTTPDGRVTVPVQLDGHEYRLMVDTGGYINTISPRVVRQEGYRPRTSQGTTLRGMGTTLLTEYVKVKDLAIGPAHGKDFIFFVDDFEGLDQDGTLAPQILGAYDVDLDFAHGKLNLIYPEHCPGRVVYWTQAPAAVVPIQIEGKTHIRIPVTVDGKEINAILDTGALTSYTTMRAASRYLAIDEKDAALKSRGNVSVNGMSGPVYNYPFQTLSFGDVTVNHPRVEIVSNDVWDNKTDLLLGIGILRQLHLYIAYKERKMYITPALAN